MERKVPDYILIFVRIEYSCFVWCFQNYIFRSCFYAFVNKKKVASLFNIEGPEFVLFLCVIFCSNLQGNFTSESWSMTTTLFGENCTTMQLNALLHFLVTFFKGCAVCHCKEWIMNLHLDKPLFSILELLICYEIYMYCGKLAS